MQVKAARDGIASKAGARKANLFFRSDVTRGIRDADLIFVAVETPSSSTDYQGGAAPDMRRFHSVIRMIGETAERNFILVIKSTVPCGTATETSTTLSSLLPPGISFEVLSNPEFLAEGTAIQDLQNPDRIVIGSSQTPSGQAAAETLASLYARWVPRHRIMTIGSRSSELSKLAANMLLAQRISSINAISALCDELGADVTEISRACGLDHRIGSHMLRSTLGFGGSCFKKDVLHITNTAARLGLADVASYFDWIVSINSFQTNRFINRIMTKMPNQTQPRTIAALGFAFKPDTDDTRESPAIPVVCSLLEEGYRVRIFDPKVSKLKILEDLRRSCEWHEHSSELDVTVCSSVYEACTGAHAIAILNTWEGLRFIPRTETQTPQASPGLKNGKLWPPSLPPLP
jgi:UDPglucose 6-dehydrogenase